MVSIQVQILKGFSIIAVGVFISMASIAKLLSKEAGWGFILSLNTGYTHSESQLNTDNDNAATCDLEHSG